MKKTFTQNVETYNEVLLLQSLTREKVSNMLQLIETFEDSLNHYIVTRYYEDGSLLDLSRHFSTKNPFPEDVIKSIIA